MKKFGVGIIVGVVATVATGVGAFLGFKQKVVKPIEDEEAKFDATRIQSARKAHQAHNARY
ncbi:DUF3042 family protein [Periweissella ghanensis]|uniref:DUF3042 family protein n=1 Tax=Periweissella ghanensis TaxID=467997 RepID=A0ABM8ZAM2_9LACO|nr:DUF3042 family protein [Periweissella ghanensis]MCM0599977.1 DUF3042 family protein [Periweissella ghanensis]CAH0418224.1 hypothetical protein WGH24286_00641 [Periweissella ghanensis]